MLGQAVAPTLPSSGPELRRPRLAEDDRHQHWLECNSKCLQEPQTSLLSNTTSIQVPHLEHTPSRNQGLKSFSIDLDLNDSRSSTSRTPASDFLDCTMASVSSGPCKSSFLQQRRCFLSISLQLSHPAASDALLRSGEEEASPHPSPADSDALLLSGEEEALHLPSPADSDALLRSGEEEVPLTAHIPSADGGELYSPLDSRPICSSS